MKSTIENNLLYSLFGFVSIMILFAMFYYGAYEGYKLGFKEGLQHNIRCSVSQSN